MSVCKEIIHRGSMISSSVIRAVEARVVSEVVTVTRSPKRRHCLPKQVLINTDCSSSMSSCHALLLGSPKKGWSFSCGSTLAAQSPEEGLWANSAFRSSPPSGCSSPLSSWTSPVASHHRQTIPAGSWVHRRKTRGPRQNPISP